MEDVKSKIGVFIAMLVGALIVIATGYFILFHKTNYWVQIDNSNVSELSPLEYEYDLRGYNEQGSSKYLKFKANKKLRNEAYLRLEVMPLRGVYRWEEVDREDLPVNVLKNL